MSKSFRGARDNNMPKRLLAYYENMEKTLVCKKCTSPLKIKSSLWRFNGTGYEHICEDGTRNIAVPRKSS